MRNHGWWRPALLFLALSALYLAGAARLGAVRWDGLAPQPYRYVSPPPGYTNPGPPGSAKQLVPFSNGASNETQVVTPDIQAQLLIGADTFPADTAGDGVIVTVEPQAPPRLSNLVVDGNAYVITATYSNGQPVPVPWKKPVMIYLVFPSQNVPAGLYRLASGQATEVSKTVDVPTLTVQGQIDRGGAYGAAGSGKAASASGTSSSQGSLILLAAIIAIGLLLVGVGLFQVVRGRSHPPPSDA